MPEGPSIVILKELSESFKGKQVIAVTGNSKAGIERAQGETVIDFKSWGKHFLICFSSFTIKIHFMLFGSYRINEEREMTPRLSLQFKIGIMNFYACSVRILEGDLNEIYDWTTDIMSDQWDAKSTKRKLIQKPRLLVCDALLDQNIFAGSGNIIKNEVLFRIKVHPKSKVGSLSARKLGQMIKDVRAYSFDFLQWKKEYTLRKHWLVHTKTTCIRCRVPLIKEYLGKYQRRTYYCARCQVWYR